MFQVVQNKISIFFVNFGYFSKAEQAQHDPKIPSIGKVYVLNFFHQSVSIEDLIYTGSSTLCDFG